MKKKPSLFLLHQVQSFVIIFVGQVIVLSKQTALVKQYEGRVRGPEQVDNLPEALQKAPLSL